MIRIMPAIALAALTACGHIHIEDNERETRTYRESIDLGVAKEASVEIHMGAGELRVASDSGTKLVQAELRTSGGRPRFRYDAGEHGRLRVEQDGKIRLGKQENDWDFLLSEQVPVDLEVHMGAGQAKLDLSGLKLRRVTVHMGAGQLDLNLRGNYDTAVEVEVHGGVGEAKIRLPRKMMIEAEVSGGLGEVDVHGLEHTGGRYVSRGSRTGPRMDLEIHGGVGRIELDAE